MARKVSNYHGDKDARPAATDRVPSYAGMKDTRSGDVDGKGQTIPYAGMNDCRLGPRGGKKE